MIVIVTDQVSSVLTITKRLLMGTYVWAHACKMSSGPFPRPGRLIPLLRSLGIYQRYRFTVLPESAHAANGALDPTDVTLTVCLCSKRSSNPRALPT